MAGNLDDPTQWRLSTQNGIKFKTKSMDGEFGFDAASVDFNVLVRSDQLVDFILEVFPPPLIVGNIEIPQTTTLPGLPGLGIQKLTFKSFDDNLPIDPFGGDPNPPPKTYFPVVELVITYGSTKTGQDPNDPFTWLEITSTATGEFLYSSVAKAKWAPETNSTLADGDDEDPNNNATDPNTDELSGGESNDTIRGPLEPTKNPTIPFTVTVPQTEWTLKWPRIPYEYFRDVLIHRLRAVMGRVNDARFPLLFNAAPETLLFAGWQYNQINTWRDGFTNIPPVSIAMKIVEKRISYNGIIIGHNHNWRPGKGWQRLLTSEGDPAFKTWDFDRIFTV